MEQTLLQRVRVRLVIQMLGSPKEHVEKTLHDYIAKLKKEPTVQILKEDYASAEPRESGLYATFVELDAWFKDAAHLLAFCFDAMPSSVEILEPLEFRLPGKEFEGLLNDLQARLHTVDLALKNLKALNKIIDTNAVTVMHNFIVYALKNGAKTAEEVGDIVGLLPDKVQPFLEKLISENRVKRSGNKYIIA